ncbi:protein PLANT CADMIUM RESISTANCE 11-like [Gossypium australe]|uniref:Protein PLANT CADMIUM RESISTANCE 11-like n=1 Tax=Gossypium australe TaxID=47621 RepID=A0A5B6VAE7_9ROSI|nr:protein PLANT CADMIUM RESISTANCE 11-like [Gossypium australe]
MYSSSPLDIGQQAPVTGIPVAPTNHQYPTQRYTPTAVKVPWSTGLYDCTADVASHVGVLALPLGILLTSASGAFFVLLSILTVCISNRIYSYTYRARLRSQYILEESPCRDCYLHFWCEACALCQEYRELKNRGFDVSLGWHGNWERQKILGVPMPMPMPMAPAEMETGMRR